LVMGNVSLILHSLLLKLSVDLVLEGGHVLCDSLFNLLVNEVSNSFSHVVRHVL
jgi:hypothetical protein